MKKNKKNRNIEEEVVEMPAKRLDPVDDDLEGLRIVKSEAPPIPYNMQGKQAPAPQGMRPPLQQSAKPTPYGESMPVDAAVLKPVPGGLQPIIAPKGQVQLSPVVVPVAFVPYATQNQPLLQTDRRPVGQQSQAKPQPPMEGIKDQPLKKEKPRAAEKRDEVPEFVSEETVSVSDKKVKTKNRIFAALLFIVTLGFFALVILNYFAAELGITSIVLAPGEPNIIAGWVNFNTSDIISQIPLFIFTVACALALINLIVAFVSICTGRGYHLWVIALLMLVVTAVGTLLCAFGVIGAALNVSINPIEANSFAWRLVFASAILLILSLIFFPRKVKNEAEAEEDDLRDLV